jgi:hypothetical protein
MLNIKHLIKLIAFNSLNAKFLQNNQFSAENGYFTLISQFSTFCTKVLFFKKKIGKME